MRSLLSGRGSEDAVENNSEQILDIPLGDPGMIEEMIEDEGIGHGAESRGCGPALDRNGSPKRFGDAVQEDTATGAKALMPGEQASVFSGVPNGEELELDREQGQLAVLGDIGVVIAKGAPEFGGVLMLFEKRVEIREALGHPLFEQGEEDVFLALEVRVEGAPGVTGERGDIFQARGFESLPRENSFRSGEQPSACRLRCELAGARRALWFFAGEGEDGTRGPG